ncbi:MAG TPA: hypothetical protein VHB77_18375 [Planctomycetaceae bacterium]|nr:hypothetical protein [Planctomycetaceae bacterium]
MSESANVTSIPAMFEFRASLVKFHEAARVSLDAMRFEVMRSLEWLQHDRGPYWQQKVREGFDDVAQARNQLENCRRKVVAGNRPACIEEQIALRNARMRLQHAQEKVEIVRRWIGQFTQASEEFRGRIGQLGVSVENDVPEMIMLMDRMLASLEAYAGLGPLEEPEEAAPTPLVPEPPAAAAPAEGD